MQPKLIKIFGGGPAALIAADFLADRFKVELFEKEKNIGQKFLVAGKGGFNLTNSLTGKKLLNNYSPKSFLKNAILEFDSQSVRNWLQNLGIQTFVGTSGRVFSHKKHKPVDVLNKIRKSLLNKNVTIYTDHNFIGFNKFNIPIVEVNNSVFEQKADCYIFSLGGASWPKTGSDGKWTENFNKIGIETNPFQASNCGININWSQNIKDYHSGKPLKNINIKSGKIISSGEAVITDYGLEGNAIYSIIPALRDANKQINLEIKLDLKPNNSIDSLLEKIKKAPYKTKEYKKLFNLNSTQLSLLKSFTTKEQFTNPYEFVKKIKTLKLCVKSLRPIEESISTVGGVKISELHKDFSLKKYPNFYTIGEMVDWDAPTGGFLLQGCFSMGYSVAQSIRSKD